LGCKGKKRLVAKTGPNPRVRCCHKRVKLHPIEKLYGLAHIPLGRDGKHPLAYEGSFMATYRKNA
jgi:hypothetical protein